MDKKIILRYPEGLGSFVDATHVGLQKRMGHQKPLKQKNIIIATGSKPSNLPYYYR
jgi:dihydrolipoamide dehydrogenase